MNATPAKMECGICWWTFDPRVGDPERNIAPGTAFGVLPSDWSCPSCGSPREKFLPKDAGAVDDATRLCRAYTRIGEVAMRGLAVFNERLSVAAVGFDRQPVGTRLGVVITPWAMNAVLLPSDAHAFLEARAGHSFVAELPSGQYEFSVQHVDGFGPIAACSLFSTVTDFVDQAAARLAAESALSELLTPEAATA